MHSKPWIIYIYNYTLHARCFMVVIMLWVVPCRWSCDIICCAHITSCTRDSYPLQPQSPSQPKLELELVLNCLQCQVISDKCQEFKSPDLWLGADSCLISASIAFLMGRPLFLTTPSHPAFPFSVRAPPSFCPSFVRFPVLPADSRRPRGGQGLGQIVK